VTAARAPSPGGPCSLPRNVRAANLTSFFNDIASEIVMDILPLYLSGVLGVEIAFVGLIEGLAESTASLRKAFSGWLSDRLQAPKWLTVAGYALSALSKPFFYVANS